MSGTNSDKYSYIFFALLILMSLLLVLFLVFGTGQPSVFPPPVPSMVKSAASHNKTKSETEMHLVVLGVAQDAGYPQADCKKSCCKEVWKNRSKRKKVSCLGVRDPESKLVYLFDATPDLKDQLQILQILDTTSLKLGGVFLTHAHMGHYTGLMHLGREAMGASQIPTYVMPRMKNFLTDNGPWSQLVGVNNISLKDLQNNQQVKLSAHLKVTPLQVPHRDEFSETVGFIIEGPNKKVLFIPDIDKWSKWDTDITELIQQVDYAFLDGTFYRNGEIWGRDMSQIPHPFISESMDRFINLPKSEKEKIHFIHLNHTNPLLDSNTDESKDFRQTDYNLAREGQVINL